MIKQNTPHKPAILAPAGNRSAFLAALAAGADAIYCGLKSMSARMEAKNFSPEELASLVKLAHDRGVRVYVTLNTLIKPDEVDAAGKTVDILTRSVKPDGLIVQDPGVIRLARQAGFSGDICLSTLANVSFPKALAFISRHLGARQVVVPRELSIDEIKAMAAACPDTMTLETFVHGALCYAVSGRCYWSSYMGGKSGLRGRCVQPCRRRYAQGKLVSRFFSCQDFSVDVLVKILSQVEKVGAWKIEGRKKGPHYVYYSTLAYRLLRDRMSDPVEKKNAVALLSQSLGREGTHYRFLPQRPQIPVNVQRQTASGLFMGKVQGPGKNPWVVVRQALLPGDVLRIGYEDEPGHAICRVTRHVPKSGRFPLKLGSAAVPGIGTPVFLTDRKERELERLMADVEKDALPPEPIPASAFRPTLPSPITKKAPVIEMQVRRSLGRPSSRQTAGVWLSERTASAMSRETARNLWVWLPPVIWPDDEAQVVEHVNLCLKKGVNQFVLNMPWQMALFGRTKGLSLWAGPFCNAANALCLDVFRDMGFAGAFVSPELGEADILALCRQRPIPLGMVLSGHWP
ncbi:U32 family peptidase, partial [Desulfosarcina sp. OttesenSCG-928-A07]|nr:U32 family peptidase [Desulfosarcina sp. OttesenSCG-928-A07]